MDWPSVFESVVASVIVAGLALTARALRRTRSPQGAFAATFSPTTARPNAADTTIRWIGAGRAWNVLALPYDTHTFMTKSQIQAHVMAEGDGELRFIVQIPGRVTILWRPKLHGRTARGHLLDTGKGYVRPMTRTEVKKFRAT